MSLGKNHKSSLRASRRGEARTATSLGGRRQPGSGNGKFAKADVKAPAHLVEHKDTQHASYTLKRSELDKLEGQANLVGRMPVFAVCIQGRQYAVLAWPDFEALLLDPPAEG